MCCSPPIHNVFVPPTLEKFTATGKYKPQCRLHGSGNQSQGKSRATIEPLLARGQHAAVHSRSERRFSHSASTDASDLYSPARHVNSILAYDMATTNKKQESNNRDTNSTFHAISTNLMIIPSTIAKQADAVMI